VAAVAEVLVVVEAGAKAVLGAAEAAGMVVVAVLAAAKRTILAAEAVAAETTGVAATARIHAARISETVGRNLIIMSS
jgi:hypothetical protein